MIEKAITEGIGPRAMAEELVASIADLDQRIAAAETKTEAKALRRRLKLNRDLLRFCKTRAGY